MPMGPLKTKSGSLHQQLMFTRPMNTTPDMIEQHRLRSHVADGIDAGHVRTTVSEVLSPIDAENIRAAQAKIETGSARDTIGVEVL